MRVNFFFFLDSIQRTTQQNTTMPTMTSPGTGKKGRKLVNMSGFLFCLLKGSFCQHFHPCKMYFAASTVMTTTYTNTTASTTSPKTVAASMKKKISFTNCSDFLCFGFLHLHFFKFYRFNINSRCDHDNTNNFIDNSFY